MADQLVIAELVVCVLVDALIVVCLYSSIREKAGRAIVFSAAALFDNNLFWFLVIYFRGVPVVFVIGFAAMVVVVLFAIFSMVKFFPKKVAGAVPIEQYDERDNMFSRNNLQYHPELAEEYYSRHPEQRQVDEAIWAKPELGEPGGEFYDRDITPVAEAAFAMLSRTRHIAEGEPAEKKRDIEAGRFVETIRQMAFGYGAVDVGVVGLRDHHFYSHAGRHSENYGERIESSHKSGIVIVVAMDIERIRQAPKAEAMVETSRQYVEAARIAHVVAEYIRSFGYDARSHVDSNYQVLCVPLAVAAGLGELGRLGILIHPVYGPCVRISVVTTELELAGAEVKDHHIEEFCGICRKCERACPSRSISSGSKSSSRGFEHWSIDQEKCYSYWKTAGSDCGICIAVCPYTKPNTIFHRLVRFYVSRNPINQRIALAADDLLYDGRRFR